MPRLGTYALLITRVPESGAVTVCLAVYAAAPFRRRTLNFMPRTSMHSRTFREQYADWLKFVLKRHPDVRRPLFAAIDAYESCRSSRRVTEAMLAPIVAAASSRRAALGAAGTDFLRELTWKHPAAREAVRKMAASGDATARFNAILSVGRGAPRGFRIALLRPLVADRSAEVRWRAAESAARVHDLPELLPDLERALGTEKSATAKLTIEDAVRVLRANHARD